MTWQNSASWSIMMMRATCCKSSPSRLSIVLPSFLKSSSAKVPVALAKAISKPSSKRSNENRNYAETYNRVKKGRSWAGQANTATRSCKKACSMKLVTFITPDRETHAGVVHNDRVTMLDYPTVLELLRDPD